MQNGIEYTSSCSLFNVLQGKMFVRKMGGVSFFPIAPKTLDPTIVFYNAIKPAMRDNGFSGKKFPLKYDNGSGAPEAININIHTYSARVVVLLVSKLIVQREGVATSLLVLQDMESHPGLHNLVKAVCSVICFGHGRSDYKSFSPKVYPVAVYEKSLGEASISDVVAVEALTRHRNPRARIIEDILKKNIDHQVDENSILIDRQGIFARYAYEFGDERNNERKMESVHCLFEVGLALFEIFSSGKYRDLDKIELDFIKILISSPDIVFIKSVTAYKTWVLIADEFKLKRLFETAVDLSVAEPATCVHPPMKKEWSPMRTWTMSIVSTLLLGVVTYFSPELYKEYIDSKERVEILSPKDGASLSAPSGEVILSWTEVKKQAESIVMVEKLSGDGKWLPASHAAGRYVTQDNKMVFEVVELGAFRWRVSIEDSRDSEIGNSKWHFFSIISKDRKVSK
ncbi:hypothetical protein [Pseudomonas sp. 24 E 13]|uniref:hypothetical protein n=1 Tax=Pseudomonas sp. 24 E 13 TaxID=1844095 RepID=UPI000812805F|nr:hypothetical protein [Pseudomonas sp. 24 E 13]CRM70338.1 hypothetical protein [Pseudomonas sp. 24 E 13]